MWLFLPPEMCLSILRHLSHGDLCRVSLVCRQLRSVAADPSLWSAAPIDKERITTAAGLDNLFSVPR